MAAIQFEVNRTAKLRLNGSVRFGSSLGLGGQQFGLVWFGSNDLKPSFKQFKVIILLFFLKYFSEQPLHYKPNSSILGKKLKIRKLKFEILKDLNF